MIWLPIAAVLCALNASFLVVGELAPRLNGHGTWTAFAIGVGVLVCALALFFYPAGPCKTERPCAGAR